jgi:protein-tyrosine-phosphatase
MAYTTTQLNQIVKETFDTMIHESYDFNVGTMARFKKEVPTEDITSIGRYFAIQVQSNESYGSQATEGGAFPAAGNLVDVKALVNYRSQFASFSFTGDVEDLATNKTLTNALKRIVKDTTESFDEKQNFFLFGDGSGTLGVVSSVSTNDITMLNTVASAYGARGLRKGQVVNAYDVAGAAYRTGDYTVSSINRTTDVVTTVGSSGTAASNSVALNDAIAFKGSYGYAPQGFGYHIADSGSWLGLSRTTYPTLKSTVHDAASASLDQDMIELAALKARNVRGDAAPKFDYLLVMHPVQHKNLRAAIRSAQGVQFNANLNGNESMDLSVKNVTPNGMEVVEDSWCAPSDVWGIRTEDWAVEEVAPRQMYKHGDGNVFIQSLASSTTYGDQKEGRVYSRYNVVCKKPFRQFRIKNVNFSTSETRIQRL